MRKAIPVMAAVSLLAGCATWGQMDSGLQSLHGQPLQAAVSKLGFPTGEARVAGMRLVSWSTSSSGVMMMPQTSTSYGNVYGPGGVASYSQTTTGAMAIPMHGQCTITLQVDGADVIRAHQYDGNMLGCERYIKALNKGRVVTKSVNPAEPNAVGLPKGGNS